MPAYKYTPTDYITQFWLRVDKSDHDSCWLWTGHIDLGGYGQVHWHGKVALAHRIAYMLEYGDISKGLLVMHTCDVRNCVNPSHLKLGTYTDNNRDRAQKGRGAPQHGEHNPAHKLSDIQISEIRNRCQSGEKTQRQLAREYAVSESEISLIVHRKLRNRSS